MAEDTQKSRLELEKAQTHIAELQAKLSQDQPPPVIPPEMAVALEPRFQKLIEHSADHVTLMDEHGKIIYSNRSVEQILGYSVDEYIGLEPADLLHPDDLPKAQAFFQLLTSAPDVSRTIVVRNRHKRGHYVWVEVNATNLLHDPVIGAIVSNSRDITGRKQIEEALRRYEERFLLLAERVEDFTTYLMDADGHVTSWNAGIERLKGYRAEEILSQHFSVFYLPEDINDGKPQRLLESARTMGHAEDEGWRVRKDGSRFWASVVIPALWNEDGSLYGFAKITRDLTKRRHAEELARKLKRAIAVLSDVNHAIVRIRQMPTLFERACHIAVEKGGFRMVWIGLLDPTTDKVKPVVYAGEADDYLEKLDIVLSDEPHGQDPAARALRGGEHVIVNDIEHDPSMAPWRDNALRLGYRASAAFPLIVEGKVRGVFNLYADEPAFFDEDELKLLDEMAGDISFAMKFAEQEEQRQQAEAVVKRYVQRMEIRHKMNTRLIEGGSIQTLVEATLKHLRELIPYQRANVAIMDQTTGEGLIFAIDFDGEMALDKGTHVPILPDVFEGPDERRVRVFDDFHALPEIDPRVKQFAGEGPVSGLQALLMAQERPIGSLGLLANTPRFFTAEYQEIASEVATRLAIAIHQLRLSEELVGHTALLEQKVAERTAELQSAKKRVEAILDNSTDGILLTHPDLRIRQVNSSFNRLFNCLLDDYFGKLLPVLAHAADAESIINLAHAVMS